MASVSTKHYTTYTALLVGLSYVFPRAWVIRFIQRGSQQLSYIPSRNEVNDDPGGYAV
jgi:hypothetical protein